VPPRPAPRDLRASDADRDRVIVVLSAALADGRLTAAEHGERVEAALSARTLGDLAALTADLTTADGQPIRLDGGRTVAGLFRRESRGGRWVVPPTMTVSAMCGEVTVDFREALLTEHHTVLYASALLGRHRGALPPRPPAPHRQPPHRPPRNAAVPGAPPAAERPLIEVRAFTVLGEILVTAPPRPRRWLPGFRRRAIQP
jgi:hypothetical protein